MIIRVNSYSASPIIQYKHYSYIEIDADVDCFENNKDVVKHIGENEILSEIDDSLIQDEFNNRNLIHNLDISEIVSKFESHELLEHLDISDEDLLDECDESSIISRARDIQIDKIL